MEAPVCLANARAMAPHSMSEALPDDIEKESELKIDAYVASCVITQHFHFQRLRTPEHFTVKTLSQ